MGFSAFLSYTLILGPVTFMLGWIVSKVYFRPAPVSAAATPAAPDVEAVQRVVEKHEVSRAATQQRLEAVQHALDQRGEEVEGLQVELRTREERAAGLAEKLANSEQIIEKLRDDAEERRAEILELQVERDELRDAAETQAATAAPVPADPARDKAVSIVRAELKKLNETLANRDEQVKSLTSDLDGMNQKFEQQKEMIRNLRQTIARQNAEPEPAQPLPPADNLQLIRGIGPALERKLISQGIREFGQLAELDREAMNSLARELSISPGRPARDDWQQQARSLADRPKAGATTGLPA